MTSVHEIEQSVAGARVSVGQRLGSTWSLELSFSKFTDSSAAAIERICTHELIAGHVRHVSLAVPSHYDVVSSDILTALRPVSPSLISLFLSVGSLRLDALATWPNPPRRLATWCRRVEAGATRLSGVLHLDLRDASVTAEAIWPDVEVVVLRPRGHSLDWVAPLITETKFPRLKEIWILENLGDELIDIVTLLPIASRLRRLDLTNALTNRGAAILISRADSLTASEIVVADNGYRRRQEEALNSVWKRPMPPKGELEVDDAWRTRLRQKFGRRVSFRVPVGHPHLSLDEDRR